MNKKYLRNNSGLARMIFLAAAIALAFVIFFVIKTGKGKQFLQSLRPKLPPVEVKTEDRNGDEKPDVFFYYRENILFKVNRDRNFDGKLDEWIVINNGKWASRKADDNFDRVVDVRENFSDQGVLQQRERDIDFDATFDETEYHDTEGSLERSEHDSNGDGKPDVWKTFKKGVLQKTEIDRTFDGKPDETLIPSN